MHPILYSFRRCPYAIRARLAIKYCGIEVKLREVVLSNKPAEMIAVSSKGTVPILVLPDGTVLDESMDIIHWALSINDPDNWLQDNDEISQKTDSLININDNFFKDNLDHYKYASRFPEFSEEHYRTQGEDFLQNLENLLKQSRCLLANHITLADIAIFPFIRQFAFVDKDWFDKSRYTNLKPWLNNMLETELFKEIMKKYPPWVAGSEGVKF